MQKSINLILFSLILILTNCNSPETASTKSSQEPAPEVEKTALDYSKFGIENESVENIKALQTGAFAPDFSGKDQNGKEIQLSELTENGDVVLVFYRGYWCGYCTKYLAAFAERMDEFAAKGAQIIAVAPEGEMNINKTAESTGLEIPFLRDADNSIMEKYGVAFKVNEMYQGKVLNFKKATLEEINDSEEAFLPIPATYIIGKDGKIKWAHFDPDYSNRASIDDILINI